jgi:hypothetical protein
MAEGLMEGKPALKEVSESRSVPSAATRPVTSGWVGEEPGALLVSLVVGTSIFVVLSLTGTLIIFQRNLNQIRSRLPEVISDDFSIEVDESIASQMSELIRTSDYELSKLDEASQECLEALRVPHESNEGTSENGDDDVAGPATTVSQQQRQIVQCLQLISLQHKKLNAYHRENLMVRNMIKRLSASPVQSSSTPAYELRQQSAGLSIKPA